MLEQLRKGSAEAWFLVLSVAFGGAMMLITPPFQVPDEPTHFYRAYQVSEGQFMATHVDKGSGGILPSSVIATANMNADMPTNRNVKVGWHKTFHYLKMPLKPEQTQPVHFENTSLYSPVPYIPQAIVILIGRLLGFSPLLLMYLARLATLAVWITLMYQAIKLINFAKWPVLVLALTPLSLFINSSLSSDVLANGLAFLAVALVVHFRATKKRIGAKELGGLVVLTLTLGLVKLPYFLLALLFLAIPAECFDFKLPWKRLIPLGLIALSLLAAILWYKAAQRLYAPYRVDAPTDTAGQIHYLIQHPVRFAPVLFNQYITTTGDYLILGFVGFLGSFEYNLPYWIILAYLAVLGLSFLSMDDQHEIISRRLRWGSGALAAVMVIVISALLYISWTPVAKNAIDGIQSRYFIPVSALLILALARRRWLRLTIANNKPAVVLVPAVSICLLAAFLDIINRYYRF